MSDQQFDQMLRWFGEKFSAGNSALENTMNGMTLTHWFIGGVFLIAFGLLMMRGLGLKKFG